MNINKTDEIVKGIYSENEVLEMINRAEVFLIKGKTKPILIGRKALVKINCNFGITTLDTYKSELEKINKIVNLNYRPDLIMDLSLVEGKEPLWKSMLKYHDGAVGYLPHYTSFDLVKGIQKEDLLEKIEKSFDLGIGFITIHPTTSLEIHEIAKLHRKIPSTSRGGMIIYKDMIINERTQNIYEELFEEILLLCKKYKVTLSIGTTYRPATVGEALDQVQIMEIKKQKKFVDIARQYNVNVMIEGVGHITLKDLFKYKEFIDDIDVNLMPLGPIVTDVAIGFDHITSAIGSAFCSYFGMSNIINVITRDEHTGGIPNEQSIIEGLKAAKVAARSVNVSRFNEIRREDYRLSMLRAERKSCLLAGGLFNYATDVTGEGCSRCAENCPLIS